MSALKERSYSAVRQDINNVKEGMAKLHNEIRNAEQSVSIKLLAQLNEKQTELMLLTIEMQGLVLADRFKVLRDDVSALRVGLARKL